LLRAHWMACCRTGVFIYVSSVGIGVYAVGSVVSTHSIDPLSCQRCATAGVRGRSDSHRSDRVLAAL